MGLSGRTYEEGYDQNTIYKVLKELKSIKKYMCTILSLTQYYTHKMLMRCLCYLTSQFSFSPYLLHVKANTESCSINC